MKMLRPVVYAMTSLAVLLAAQVGSADGMRCGTQLVSEGDTTYEVRSICGEPDAMSHRIELRTVRAHVSGPCTSQNGQVRCGHYVERTIEVAVDEWTYDQGSNRFIRFLRFEDGKLHSVRTGDYGRK